MPCFTMLLIFASDPQSGALVNFCWMDFSHGSIYFSLITITSGFIIAVICAESANVGHFPTFPTSDRTKMKWAM